MGDVRVVVERVLFDKHLGACAVVLKEQGADRSLPIWIGQSEAISIAIQIEKVDISRPITHDLLTKIVEELGGHIEWVKVTDLVDGTYYAVAHVTRGVSRIDVDCRPSDAIAIALRTEAPVYIAEEVFAKVQDAKAHAASEWAEVIDASYLENLPDDVFGKYKM